MLRLQRLEAANAELGKEKARLEEELSECKQLLKSECQASQNLSLSLDSETQIRMQLEAEVRDLVQRVQAQKETEADGRHRRTTLSLTYHFREEASQHSRRL